MPEASTEARLVSEFTGTFILILTIGCNVLTNQSVWAGVSIASALTVMIYALGNSSGAHFNPAVSLALGIAKKEQWPILQQYIATQIFAGLVAGMCYSFLLWGTTSFGPKPGFSVFQAGMVEMLYTFMLCFVVLNVAASKKDGGKNQYYGLAIGFVIVAGAYGAGNISGGCFNPAVALALDASSLADGFGTSIIYIFFEMVGAALAAIVFRSCRPEEKDPERIPPDQYDLGNRMTSEFVGTYFLVLTVGLNVITQSVAGAFSIAASLMCMIFALGSVSGGHFNPAVTTALVARGKFEKKDAPKYIAAQCAGGIAAAFTYSVITQNWNTALGPTEPYTALQAFTAELVYTFVLAFVVLSVATVEGAPSEYTAFAIGSCVTVGGFAIGGVSGGSLNPAVSLGITSAHLMAGGGVLYFLEYAIAEIIAGFVAALVFSLTRPSEVTKKESAEKV